MVGVDSNIVLRLLLKDDPAQAELAHQSVESSDQCFIDVSVLSEVIWVLKRGYRFDRSRIVKVIEVLLQTQNFVFKDKDAIWQALKDYKSSSADFTDCLIGQRNQHGGCETTLTFDIKAGRLGSFTLVS